MGNVVIDGTPRVEFQPKPGYVPTIGDTFTVVANDGGQPISGQILLLPEGSEIWDEPYGLHISYVGGTGGHDVTLTLFAAQSTPTLVVDPVSATFDGLAHPAPFRITALGGVDLSGSVVVTYTDASNNVLAGVPVSAGTYAVRASFPGNVSYRTVEATNIVVIARATLTIQAQDATRHFGLANPPLVATYSGATPGETFAVTASTLATPASPVGTYAITSFVSGATLANYTVVATNGTLTVTNTTPTAGPGGPYSVAEGGSVLLSGAGSTDPDGDVLSYAWDLDGDGVFGETGTAAGRGDEAGLTPTFSAAGLDGYTGSTFTVKLRVSDPAGAANVAPTASISGPANGQQGNGLGFEATGVSDPGAADTSAGFAFAWQVTRGGTPVDLTGIATNGATFGFVPIEPGNYAVTLTVADKDGGSSTVVRAVVVGTTSGITLLPGGRLVIVGTGGADSILVNPGGGAPEIKVKLNGTQQTFVGVTSIVIFANAGNDDVQVVGGIRLPATIFGGAGNDSLKGGAGDDVLLVGDGDVLLVGGRGADKIVGDAGDDLLIAGYTAFDANDTALAAVMAEWTSSRSYVDRVKNLRGDTTGGSFTSRANGQVYLAVDGTHGRAVTVLDDGDADVLTGSAGQDWFLFNVDGDNAAKKDKTTDLSAVEFADDLDFITTP